MNEIAVRLAARLFDREVIQNQYRSEFIEEMISPLLAQDGWSHNGGNWAGWDFEHADGTRLEVKQSAAEQTWAPSGRKPSPRRFDVAARKGHYIGAAWTATAGRLAGLYVFAWNGHRQPLVDHRDPAQWTFFVVPAIELPRDRKSVTIIWLENWAGGDRRKVVGIGGLQTSVADAKAKLAEIGG